MPQMFVSRNIHGVKDVDILSNAQKRDRNVLLMGDTGSGKTMLFSEFAKQKNQKFVKIPCAASNDPAAMFGKISPKEGAVKDNESFLEWVDGSITALIRWLNEDENNKGVLLFDEINMLQPAVQATVFPLLDKNRELIILDHNEVLKPPAGSLLIGATMNPGYRGTGVLNKAFANRFSYTLEWDYDTVVENELCESQPLLELVHTLRNSYHDGTLSTPFSTNMILEFMEMFEDFGFDMAVAMISTKYNEAGDNSESDSVVQSFNMKKHSIVNSFKRAKQRKMKKTVDTSADLGKRTHSGFIFTHNMGWAGEDKWEKVS